MFGLKVLKRRRLSLAAKRMDKKMPEEKQDIKSLECQNNRKRDKPIRKFSLTHRTET